MPAKPQRTLPQLAVPNLACLAKPHLTLPHLTLPNLPYPTLPEQALPALINGYVECSKLTVLFNSPFAHTASVSSCVDSVDYVLK